MSRIAAVFERLIAEGRKALIPYITAGDPDAEATLPLMHGLVAAGSDIIELGVPFSDPMADGPTIQRASERALANGMSLKGVLDIVRRFRETDNATAVVLMGYANPVEAMGVDNFVAQAKAAGVDGVLIVDYPPQECRELSAKLKAVSIDPIFLLAPTSVDARFAEVAEAGSGYIYYVSLKGVTGAGHLDLQEVSRRIPVIRQKVGMPVGVGFGIRDAATAAGVAGFADAVVVGSRIIEEIEQSPRGEVVARVQNLVAGLRQAIDQVKEGVQA